MPTPTKESDIKILMALQTHFKNDMNSLRAMSVHSTLSNALKNLSPAVAQAFTNNLKLNSNIYAWQEEKQKHFLTLDIHDFVKNNFEVSATTKTTPTASHVAHSFFASLSSTMCAMRSKPINVAKAEAIPVNPMHDYATLLSLQQKYKSAEDRCATGTFKQDHKELIELLSPQIQKNFKEDQLLDFDKLKEEDIAKLANFDRADLKKPVSGATTPELKQDSVTERTISVSSNATDDSNNSNDNVQMTRMSR